MQCQLHGPGELVPERPVGNDCDEAVSRPRQYLSPPLPEVTDLLQRFSCQRLLAFVFLGPAKPLHG
jgi:hypothetical protein